mgnify:FL=1
MKGLPDTNAKQFIAYNTTASGSDGVITLAAPTDGSQHVLDWIWWSYGAAPVTWGMTISGMAATAEAATTIATDITAAGTGQVLFGDRGLRAVVNTAVVITLLNGTAAKKLIVQYR